MNNMIYLYNHEEESQRILQNRIYKSRNKYEILFERDGDACWICEKKLYKFRHHGRPDDTSIDHLLPKFYGGPDLLYNFKLAHANCNAKRGTLMHVNGIDVFILFISTKMKHKLYDVFGSPQTFDEIIKDARYLTQVDDINQILNERIMDFNKFKF